MCPDHLQPNFAPQTHVAICLNLLVDPEQAWSADQDAILNQRGLEKARQTIAAWPGYAPTPLVHLPALAKKIGVGEILYKDEGGRFGLGSFKALGGAYAVANLLRSQLEARLGKPVSLDDVTAGAYPAETAGITVCCATDGNHGRSVAWGAKMFGCACVIFIHQTVSEKRREAIEAYGAEVRRCEGNYDDSVREAQATATEHGWFVVSDTSYPGYMDVPKDVMQGYEVMADEAFAKFDTPPTHVFLQTGVGGMAAAVAANAVRRWGAERPKIILCDPDQAACWFESFQAGEPVAVGGDLDTLMAGLACGEVSALAWEILKDHADAVMSLSDGDAIVSMRLLANPGGTDPAIVAGESAVAGLAGLIAAMRDQDARVMLGLDVESTVVVFGTEADTDPDLYRKLVGKTADEVRA